MQYREPSSVNMRIYKHEDSRFQGRIGATAAVGGPPRSGGLPTTDRREVSGRSSQFGLPLDESLSSWRRWRFGGTRPQWTPTETHTRARASSFGMVPAFADQLWLSHRTLDRGTGGAGDLSQVAYQVSSALSQPVARRTTHHSAEAAIPEREHDEDEVQRWLREEWPRIKKVRRGGVHTWC